MQERLQSRLTIVTLGSVCLVLAVGALAAASTLAAPSSIAQAVPLARPTHNDNPTPLFNATGGPFISVSKAESIAGARAGSPIARTATQFLKYSDVISWTGNRTYTIDPSREVYVVVLSAQLQTRGADQAPPMTCLSYSTVVDATTGQIFIVRCGDGIWTSSLPAAFDK